MEVGGRTVVVQEGMGGRGCTTLPNREDKRVVYGSMQGLTKCLAFIAETSEDFADGWLPTLDFKIRVNSENIIEYSFYEKPTASNRCLQADTALNHNYLIR
jgi:hypothetical protein